MTFLKFHGTFRAFLFFLFFFIVGPLTYAQIVSSLTNPPVVKVWFKKPESINTPKIHYWNVKPKRAGSVWDGLLMMRDSAKGPEWYSYTIKNASSINLLFHGSKGYKSPNQYDISGGSFDGNTNSWVTTEDTLTKEPPEGLQPGITYLNDSTVLLCLYAPAKQLVAVKGDFNDWTPKKSLMYRSPDNTKFWLQINNLIPGKEYAYQYVVDNTLVVGDPYCDKVITPYEDLPVSETVYPDLMPYPTGKTTGIVSILQTGQKPFYWNITNFEKPAVADLVIYEMLIGDFVKNHTYKSVMDSLDYLKNLGINALELMPVMEYEGNITWGYTPIYLFAPEKYYGTKDDLKRLIDKAHEKGMAVILDIVLNHQFGGSPMVQLYFDTLNHKPAKNNPWFNQVSTHPYTVGYDFNHESHATKEYIDRVNKYWVNEYKADGFRFDLSKGFTQTHCENDPGCMSRYDPSRIKILKRMYDKIKENDANTFVILEHFAGDKEEIILSDYGMLLWGIMTRAYTPMAEGYSNGADISRSYFKARAWHVPGLISYMESHDEERVLFNCLKNGNSSGNYSVREFKTALSRMKAAGAFLYLLPGPKMLYQFGELGYDYSIKTNGRIHQKPIRWDYYEDPDRFALYEAWAQIIQLKHDYPLFKHSFCDSQYKLTGLLKKFRFSDTAMDVVVAGNFDVIGKTIVPDFQQTGVWYDYLSDGSPYNVKSTTAGIFLQPGEFHIWTSKKIPLPQIPDYFVQADTSSARTNAPAALLAKTKKNIGSKIPALKCFPNPFDNWLNITYTAPESAATEIAVIDLLGNELYVIHKAWLEAGVTTFEWDGKINEQKLPPGIYYIRTVSNQKVLIEKVAFLW